MRLGRVKIAAGQPSRLRPFELSATFHAPSIPIDPYDACQVWASLDETDQARSADAAPDC